MRKLVTITFLLISVLVFSQKSDSLLVVFPAKYNLELKGKQQNQLQEFSEYIPKNETFENYSIIATQLIIRNGKSLPLELFRDKVVEDTKKDTKNFKYTELKSAENAIIFKTMMQVAYGFVGKKWPPMEKVFTGMRKIHVE